MPMTMTTLWASSMPAEVEATEEKRDQSRRMDSSVTFRDFL